MEGRNEIDIHTVPGTANPGGGNRHRDPGQCADLTAGRNAFDRDAGFAILKSSSNHHDVVLKFMGFVGAIGAAYDHLRHAR